MTQANTPEPNKSLAGILVMASNSVDILAQIAQEVSGLPAGQVIGTGTLVITARLRGLLAEELGIEPRAVNAYIIGEHRDSEIAVWSGARAARVALGRYPGAWALPDYGDILDRVRRAAPEVVKRTSAPSWPFRPCCRASTGSRACISARRASWGRTGWSG